MKETPPQSTPYSHAEWAHSNLANFGEAEDARHRSEEVSNRVSHGVVVSTLRSGWENSSSSPP